MIYLDLFLGFLKVGLFSFGGAYGAIPVIREVVTQNGWVSEEKFAYLLAISESTPGPIMVNTATYIGNEVGKEAFGILGGLLGSALATFTVCMHAFVIILVLSMILKNALKNPYVLAVLDGIKPCIIGIIMATIIETIFFLSADIIMPIFTDDPVMAREVVYSKYNNPLFSNVLSYVFK